MAIERFLSIVVKNWRTVYFKPKHALYTCLSLIAFFFAFNAQFLFTITFDGSNSNGTGACASSSVQTAWRPVTYLKFSNLID